MAAYDFSSIDKLPDARVVDLPASGYRVVTLPLGLGPYTLTIGPLYATDGTTLGAGTVSFDSSLADGDAVPAIANGAKRHPLTSGQTKEFSMGADSKSRALQVAISGPASGWAYVTPTAHG